jgi:hypothetical protein
MRGVGGLQQSQVFRLTSAGVQGMPLWAYRYRIGGRDGKRVQRGGFAHLVPELHRLISDVGLC